MREKWLAVALATFLALGGATEAAAEEGAPAAAAAGIGQDAPWEPSEGAPLRSLAVDPSLRHIGLQKTVFSREVMEGGKLLLRQSWAELALYDADNRSMLRAADFPGLQAALRAYGRREREQARAARKEIARQAARDLRERQGDFPGYRDCRDLMVRRADSLAVSILAAGDSYTGGPHGMYGFQGASFDTATGRRLALGDVFSDTGRLADILLEELRAKYPEALFDSAEETVRRGAREDRLEWTLDARGVTFYFSPYDVAPYASGLLTATFLFDERPGLFRERYMRGPLAYCETLPAWVPLAVSLRDGPSGRKDMLEVSLYDEALHIRLNGEELADGPVPAGTEILPVHVHTAEGRNFLYVECDGPDGRMLRSYSLDGGKPALVGTEPNSFRAGQAQGDAGQRRALQWVMTDPEEFTVSDPHEAGKKHVVNVHEDGRIAFG